MLSLRFRDEPSSAFQYLLCYLFTVLMVLAAAIELEVFSSFNLNALRADNFWSYSSGIIRRGLSGELIYYFDRLFGNGPRVYALLLVSVFAFFTYQALREAAHRLSLSEVCLLGISPLVLFYEIDTEVMALLPLLTVNSKHQWVRVYGTLALIAVGVLFREITLILHFPILLYLLLSRTGTARFLSVGLCMLSIVFILSPKPAPNYLLETTYWNAQGLELLDHHLYRFVEMSIGDVLPLHLTYIADHALLILPAICGFLLFSIAIVFHRTHSILLSCYCAAAISLCFVLTVDYGRYFYFFMLYVLLLPASIATPFINIERAADQRIYKRLHHSLTLINRYRVCWLMILVVAPSGYWAGAYEPVPRIWDWLHTW